MANDMSDDEFLEAFERGTLAHPHHQPFGHREHIRMAWLAVHRYGLDQAIETAEAGLRRIASDHGVTERYSSTRTAVWVRLVAHHVKEAPTLTFDEFLVRFDPLLDSHLLDEHFSPELLTTPESRSRVVTPDRRPLPAGV
jgi:hypothetical protein